MTNESKDDSGDKFPPGGVERRKGERRDPERDRRTSDRVVADPKPRRQSPGRRSSDE